MILPIKQQFASPELCKRLVELGAPAETACRWIIEGDGITPYVAIWDGMVEQWAEGAGYELVPAYSVAELGELLRRREQSMPDWYYGVGRRWGVERDKRDDGDVLFFDTEADARAGLLIHFLETGQLTFEEVGDGR